MTAWGCLCKTERGEVERQADRTTPPRPGASDAPRRTMQEYFYATEDAPTRAVDWVLAATGRTVIFFRSAAPLYMDDP
jgi:hypothetical protein